MPFVNVNQEQYDEQRNLRDMIDGELKRIYGELKRITVTDDLKEIDEMVGYLQRNILQYAQMHRNRINGIYEKR